VSGTAGSRPVILVVAAIAAVALVVALVRRSEGPAGPPDTAAALVPASALAYVHLSTDPARAADRRFQLTAATLPSVRRLRDGVLRAVAPGGGLDLAHDVRPWLGREVAYAATSPTDSIFLAAVADRPKAQALLARVGNLEAASRYRDVAVLTAGPTALAFVGDFLVVGTVPAVRAAIDRAAGDGAALADADAFRRATADRPAGRSLDAYATAAGVRTVLAPRTGLLGALGRLLDRPGLSAAAATLAAEPAGLRATARVLGGGRRGSAFTPVLLERVPEAAAAYAGARSAPQLAQLAAAVGGGAALAGLRAALPGLAGVDLDRDVLAPLEGEVALSVTTAAALGGADPAAVRTGGAPVVTLKARTRNPRATEAALARLRDPLATRLGLPGTIPAFRAQRIGGLDAFTLRITPQLAPTYAVSGNQVIVSTAPAGLLPPRGTLAAAPAFRTTIGQVPDTAESILFTDLRQLVALGEQTGLDAAAGFASLRGDLRRARALGAVVTPDPAHPTDTNAELFLEIP
jgi:hypothetical protein